jgi:hypothetical protein
MFHHALLDNASEARRLGKLLHDHGEVAISAFAEALFAAAFGGKRMPRGNRDFDVSCPKFGKVEVRARVLGTDGAFPRVTLSKSPDGQCDHIAAIRLDENLNLWKAIILPSVALKPLYDAMIQSKGKTAHIGWSDFSDDSKAVDITAELMRFGDTSPVSE